MSAMPTFDDTTTTPAAPEEVWKALYDPARFPEWWVGVETVEPGDDGTLHDVPGRLPGLPDAPGDQHRARRTGA